MAGMLIWSGWWGGIVTGLMLSWPLVLLLGVGSAMKLVWRASERRRLAGSGIDEIDGMDGRTFERYAEILFEGLGYRIELARAAGDYGADLATQKDGVRTVIQARRCREVVGVRAVQEAMTAKAAYRCAAAMVVTNSRYTAQARMLAAANEVRLWDRDDLVRALRFVRVHEPSIFTGAVELEPFPLPAAQAPAAAPDPGAPEETPCRARCDRSVSLKAAERFQAHTARFRRRVADGDRPRGIRRPVLEESVPGQV